MQDRQRLGILDGFRALAIFLVILFHYFVRWTQPWSDRGLYESHAGFTDNIVLRHGYLGVHFFFMVSGFVIAMTLTRTRGFVDFGVNRFARLFPAMVVCSIITFALLTTLLVTPGLSNIALTSFLPAWTFTDPDLWSRVLGPTEAIDGAYWSLFVEVRFYFWAALIYYLAPRRFVTNFFGLSLGVVVLATILPLVPGSHVASVILDWLAFPQFVLFFTAGILFFDLYQGSRDARLRHLQLLMTLGTLAGVTMVTPHPSYQTTAVVVAFIVAFFGLFYLFVFRSKSLSLLGAPLIASIGLASYALYLLHQKIGVALLSRVPQDPWIYLAAVLAVIAALSLLASVIHRLVEDPAKGIIQAQWKRVRKRQVAQDLAGSQDATDPLTSESDA